MLAILHLAGAILTQGNEAIIVALPGIYRTNSHRPRAAGYNGVFTQVLQGALR